MISIIASGGHECIFFQLFPFAGGHRGVFRPALEGSVVLCAVCYTQRSPTVSLETPPLVFYGKW